MSDIDKTIRKLKADLAYHQAERERLAVELSDLDEPYSAETDTAESYAAGRVEALTNAIDILLGRDVTMYSETIEAHDIECDLDDDCVCQQVPS